MSARDVMRDGIIKETGVSLATTRADAAYFALTAAGYRILAPGDLDPVTVERCAQEADEHSYARDIDWWLTATKKDVSADACRSVATAIRSLQENKNG